jgi:hypothetical protein
LLKVGRKPCGRLFLSIPSNDETAYRYGGLSFFFFTSEKVSFIFNQGFAIMEKTRKATLAGLNKTRAFYSLREIIPAANKLTNEEEVSSTNLVF